MSKFRAGDLNEKIVFLIPQNEAAEPDTPRTNLTSRDEVFVAGRKVSANVKYVSDRERWNANALQQTVKIRFVVRKTEIKHNWRISYGGAIYAINGFKPIDHSFIEITVGAVK